MKILFRAYNFIPHFPVDIIRGFFITEFGAENLKVNKTSEKDHSFCNTVLLKKYHSFTNLSSSETENNMLQKHSQETFSVYKFSSKIMFLFGIRKNICTAPFPDTQELLSWSTLKTNVCIFLYISLINFCFKDVSRFYLVIWGVWGGWIISLRWLTVWVS